MATKTNNFDNVTEAAVVDATSSAGSGDAITRATPTGTPTGSALTAAGLYGRGLRVIGAVGDIDAYSFALTGDVNFIVGYAFRVDSTKRPTTATNCRWRVRTSSANVMKFVETTAGVLAVQNSAGSGQTTFNGGAAPADGYYFVRVTGTINTTTGTAGSITCELYNAATGVQVGSSITSTTFTLGTAVATTLQFGKPESAAGCNVDMDYVTFGTATTTLPALPVSPSSAYAQIKGNTFDGGTNDVAITTGNTGGTSGDAFDLVQANSQVLKFSNTSVISGSLAAAFEQNAGSTNQVSAYWTWSGSAAWFGMTAMVRVSKMPTGTLNIFRFFSDAAYSTSEAHIALTSAGKLVGWEEGFATVTSTGTLAANSWYAFVTEYRVSTNAYTVKAYQRGTNTIVAQVSVTLSSPVAIGSMKLGLNTTLDTGNMRLTVDDLLIGRNGVPDRTDLGNAPPVTLTFTGSKTDADAGGSVTFTADASDPDGSVVDATWTITATAGVTPPVLTVLNALQAKIACRAALVDHAYTVTYTPIDDLGLVGETSTASVNVRRATEIQATSGAPIPLAWYLA